MGQGSNAAIPTFSDLIEPEFMEPTLKGRRRAVVLAEMVALAERTGLVLDSQELLRSVSDREHAEPTALAGGFALLHPKSYVPQRFRSSFMVVGRTMEPIPFRVPEELRPDVFFLSCCQNRTVELGVMGHLLRAIKMTQLLQCLRQAVDGPAMYQSLIACEAEMRRRRWTMG
ncbi:PTS sugar transporter subunit IIA [bacterium]|nr:PTS sugar transporter subunit IIA [bacterium]